MVDGHEVLVPIDSMEKECPICHSKGLFTFEAICENCSTKLHRCNRCGKKLEH